MSRQELIDRAKVILAEAYEEVAYFIAEWREKRPAEDLTALCKEIDPHNWNGLRRKVQRAAKALKSSTDAESAARAAETHRKNLVKAKAALKDPQHRRQVMRDLEDDDLHEVAQEATEVAVDRARAKRAEHSTEPTVRDLMGDDKFDPAEFWADTLIIRVNRNARELAHLIKRGGGLLFGTMPPGEAFEYLNEAERLIADARAAAQELARDQVEV